MADPTNAELLTLARTALSSRLSGRPINSASLEGTRIEYMTITELQKLIDDLERKIAAGRRHGVHFTDARGYG